MKQTEKILDYCEKHGSITVRDAFETLHINSPTKRISEIRKTGMFDIQTVTEKRENSNKDTVHYKRYFIRRTT